MADGTDPTSLAIGAAVTGSVALIFGIVKGLFNRNVATHDKQVEADRAAAVKSQDEMRADVKNILLEIRSMHDEQTRQRAEIMHLNKEVATLGSSVRGAHDRIDALVSPAPGRGRNK